jgi:hypothetical protein
MRAQSPYYSGFQGGINLMKGWLFTTVDML